jgi:hypothetical protein
MTHRWLRFVAVGCWLGVASLVTGCGVKEVRGAKLRGKVVKDGQPVKPVSGERGVWVTFERTESWGGNPVIVSSGSLQKDGTFLIEGQGKKGTPPGKYKVMINAEVNGDGEDRFRALFPGGQSPFAVEVTDRDDQSFVIDVGKKTITPE